MEETGLRMTRSGESVVVVFSDTVLRLVSALDCLPSGWSSGAWMGGRNVIQQPGVCSVGFRSVLHGVDGVCAMQQALQD